MSETGGRFEKAEKAGTSGTGGRIGKAEKAGSGQTSGMSSFAF